MAFYNYKYSCPPTKVIGRLDSLSLVNHRQAPRTALICVTHRTKQMSSSSADKDPHDRSIGQCTYCLVKNETVKFAVCEKCEKGTGPPRICTTTMPDGQPGVAAYPYYNPDLGAPKAPISPPKRPIHVPEGRRLMRKSAGYYLSHVPHPTTLSEPPAYDVEDGMLGKGSYRRRVQHDIFTNSILSTLYQLLLMLIFSAWDR